MSVKDAFKHNGSMESVVINSYGETAMQYVNEPGWQERYAEYLRNYKVPETCDDNRRLQFAKLRSEK